MNEQIHVGITENEFYTLITGFNTTDKKTADPTIGHTISIDSSVEEEMETSFNLVHKLQRGFIQPIVLQNKNKEEKPKYNTERLNSYRSCLMDIDSAFHEGNAEKYAKALQKLTTQIYHRQQ